MPSLRAMHEQSLRVGKTRFRPRKPTRDSQTHSWVRSRRSVAGSNDSYISLRSTLARLRPPTLTFDTWAGVSCSRTRCTGPRGRQRAVRAPHRRSPDRLGPGGGARAAARLPVIPRTILTASRFPGRATMIIVHTCTYKLRLHYIYLKSG